jgi:large subunit ribosomal protein L17
MRHGKKHNHLGRQTSHRRALLANLAAALVVNKRITTTVAKAKALRVYVEPLITKSKNDTTHSRRTVFSSLQNKDVLKELYGPVAEKVALRPGGYTRIIKLGNRAGDNAEMALIELVDFNEIYVKDTAAKSTTAKRSRRGGAKATAAKPATEAVATDAPAAESESAE